MAMAFHHKTILAMVVLFSMVSKGSCVRCYYCNSANNSACLDTNKYDDELRARIIPVVNCETAVPGFENVPLFCRKIEQTIFHPDRETEVRVTRGCGWIADQRDKPCYRINNAGHYETVCQCFDDYCNAGESTSPETGVALFILFAAVLYFYR